MDNIRLMLHRSTIQDETAQMKLDVPPKQEPEQPPPPPAENSAPRPIGAKMRALRKYVRPPLQYRKECGD